MGYRYPHTTERRCEAHGIASSSRGIGSIVVDRFCIIDSTQTFLLEVRLHELERKRSHAELQPTDVFIAVSDHQENGRGNGTRTWFSSSDYTCVALSFLFEVPSEMIPKSPLITQLLAASATQALESLTSLDSIAIKWPNDIMISSRKVGGILAELVPMSDDSHAMIIGIGLNLDVPEDVLLAGISREGRWAPGSIKQQTGVSLPRETVWEKISEIFLSKLSDFFSGRNIDLRPINEKQFMYGSQIRFRSSPDVPPIQGIHRGIDHLTGGIVMEQDGVVKTFHSGEIFELNS